MITRKLSQFVSKVKSSCIFIHYSNFHTHQTSLMVQSKLTVDNVSINFDRVGNGDHAVLCMPGALGKV